MPEKIKVLVVDDSSFFRKVVTDILESDPEISVVGTAENGKKAIISNALLNPDIITMDIEMPVMDGLSALKHIIAENPKPVIMMSVLTWAGADATFKALDYGAIDFISKPSPLTEADREKIAQQLIAKIKSVGRLELNFSSGPGRNYSGKNHDEYLKRGLEPGNAIVFNKNSKSDKIVALGTSTGGPSALMKVLGSMPSFFPAPLMVVQHMPPGFTKAFADRLDKGTRLSVKEAEDGDVITPGRCFVAPGDRHILVEKSGKQMLVRTSDSEKVSGHRPSIDVMFRSIAEHYQEKSIGVIMTGMGSDGAAGLKEIKIHGGYTIAQDERSSVVFGMNRVAIEKGAVSDIVPLSVIAEKIIEYV